MNFDSQKCKILYKRGCNQILPFFYVYCAYRLVLFITNMIKGKCEAHQFVQKPGKRSLRKNCLLFFFYLFIGSSISLTLKPKIILKASSCECFKLRSTVEVAILISSERGAQQQQQLCSRLSHILLRAASAALHKLTPPAAAK